MTSASSLSLTLLVVALFFASLCEFLFSLICLLYFFDGLSWSFKKPCVCIQTLCDLLITPPFTNSWMLAQVLSAAGSVIREQQLFAAILTTLDKLSKCLQPLTPACSSACQRNRLHTAQTEILERSCKMPRFSSEQFFEQGG